MRARDVKRLNGHMLTNGGHLRGWFCPPFIMVEHGLFYAARIVWFAHHHPLCIKRDDA